MNNDFIRDFCPEEGGMDKVLQILEKEGIYMGKYVDHGDDFEAYNLGGCTIFVYNDKIRFGGRLSVTISHFSSQLEKKASIKLEEIK